MNTPTTDWNPSGDREQHELPEPGTYEAIIAEVPKYWKDHTYQGSTSRIERAHVTVEIDSVNADGKRFVLTSPSGHPSFVDRSNLVAKFCKFLDLNAEGAKTAGGINKYMVGRGIKFMVVHSKPKEDGGIVYANIVPETLEWSDNGLKVSDNFKTQSEMFPDSQWENPEEHRNGDGDDNDLPSGF